MASTHRSARRGLTGRRVLLTLVAAGGVVLAPLPAFAAPEQPTTSQEAAALVAARGHDLEVVTERFNDAREALTTKQAEAEQARQQVQAAEAAVGTARDQVRQVARSAYTGDQLSTLQAMLSSTSADDMLDRVGTLGTIADHNNEVLAAAQAATEQADAAEAAAEKATADAQTLVDQVAAQQADLDTQIAEYKAAYDRLSAEEKARAEAEAAAAARAAAADAVARASQAASRAERAQSSSAGSSSAGSSSSSSAAAAPAAAAPAASGAAATAVSTALAQKGKPYVWAAAGPDSFDCSGLTQFAYAAAGISLPHSSSTQARMGTAVTRAQLQPGDLVAFYSPVSHIGIYIGNGQMVHAPTSGDVVKISSIDAMGSITAMRRLG
ncbi:Cell wall-associated hydrolase, invasion-associated protein [Modestobacter italicus]|uniref:Cell wall-associated hydrolase, invasion-associated protein n=1 Tax=Modestobacter italicus (strain DSM 44449 / CECT 9708 / BC 501) TaxID=2732864 RepID=I4F4Q9_MODI5|nr:C40 family peptidase [Modestobacter marinus]CCH90622.1 Cell wall-associated hydrolase, invasion-associated protein [Modestobacter marinus]